MLESIYSLRTSFWSSTVHWEDGWSVTFRGGSRIDSFVYKVGEETIATVSGEGGGGGFIIDTTSLVPENHSLSPSQG